MMLTAPSGDRRGSARWRSGKALRWRPRRGRRIRTSLVIERSLNGMVLRVAPPDDLRVGAWLLPADDADAVRHGFRSAIVRRQGRDGSGAEVLYVEILA